MSVLRGIKNNPVIRCFFYKNKALSRERLEKKRDDLHPSVADNHSGWIDIMRFGENLSQPAESEKVAILENVDSMAFYCFFISFRYQGEQMRQGFLGGNAPQEIDRHCFLIHAKSLGYKQYIILNSNELRQDIIQFL